MAISKREHYEVLLKKLESQQLIGTTSIGDLKATCTHKHWLVVDDHGHALGSGKSASGKSMREAIGKVVRRWVRNNPTDY